MLATTRNDQRRGGRQRWSLDRAVVDEAERGFAAFGNVGNTKSDFHRMRSSGGETAALHGGEMLADGVDVVDRRAATDERAMHRLEIFERDGWIKRELDQRGAAAGEQEDKCVRAAIAEHIQRCASGGETLLIGNRMPGDKNFKAGERTWRRCWADTNAC